MVNSGFVPNNSNLKKTSGTPNLFFNTKDSLFFKRNAHNIAYKVTSTQLPAMVGGAFVDLYLTQGHMREPHWHPNAWELDVIVSGEAMVSIVDPDTRTLHNYKATAGQVVFIPMAWWHWIRPLSAKLHLHLFFNNDQFESAEGSDTLRLTPPEVFQAAYGVNSEKVAEAFSPITDSVVIGPPTKPANAHQHANDKVNHEISVNINHKPIDL